MLAATIMALIALATYTTYASAARLHEHGMAREEARRSAMEVYRALDQDLRSAWPFGTPPDPESLNQDDIVAAVTAAQTGAFTLLPDGSGGSWWTVRGASEGCDLAYVVWELASDGTLTRRELPVRTPADTATLPDPEVIARNVVDFRLTSTSDTNVTTLPSQIDVVLGIETRVRGASYLETFDWTSPCLLYRSSSGTTP